MIAKNSNIKVINSAICWKLLKLSVPKCENLIDVTMDNQQGRPYGEPSETTRGTRK
jgi:hypothetical protein